MARLRWLILFSGVLLFGYVLWSTGPRRLGEDLLRQGWAILPYLALTGVENLFHTLSSRRCFSRAERHRISLGRLFLAYQAGYALNLVTPTAEIGGEVARAAFFQTRVPGSEAASAVVINKFTYSVARMITAALFAGLAVFFYPLPPEAAWSIGLGSALTALALAAFAFTQAKGLFGPALVRLAWFTGRAGREWVQRHVGELDRRLREYYVSHRGDLILAIAWDMTGFGVGTIQKWLLMSLFVETPVSLLAAAAVFGTTNLIGMMFFFVTGGLGVAEESHKISFEAIGLEGEKGVALSLVARADQVVWILVGLLAYYHLLRASPRGMVRAEDSADQL